MHRHSAGEHDCRMLEVLHVTATVSPRHQAKSQEFFLLRATPMSRMLPLMWIFWQLSEGVMLVSVIAVYLMVSTLVCFEFCSWTLDSLNANALTLNAKSFEWDGMVSCAVHAMTSIKRRCCYPWPFEAECGRDDVNRFSLAHSFPFASILCLVTECRFCLSVWHAQCPTSFSVMEKCILDRHSCSSRHKIVQPGFFSQVTTGKISRRACSATIYKAIRDDSCTVSEASSHGFIGIIS